MTTKRVRGSIVQRGGSLAVAISTKDPLTGKWKKKWHSVPGGDYKAAQKLQTELLLQIDKGIYIAPVKTTVNDFLKRWLVDYCRPNLTPRSLERYVGICDKHLFPALGRLPLAQISAAQVQALYSEKLKAGLNPRSVKYIHVVLHKAMQTALKWGLVGHNPCDAVDIPKAHPPEMQTWNETEINTFLEAAKGSAYYSLFFTYLYTGARRGEVLALRWQDIDFVFGQISINRTLHHLRDGSYIYTAPKSAKSRRTIAMPPSLFLMLEAYRKAKEVEAKMLGVSLNDGDLAFSTLGKPLRPETITRAWANMAKRAGVKPIRLHDARHSHASLLLKQGIHGKVVQERLGHSSIAVTLDLYSHVAPGLQETAAKRFDEALKIKDNVPVKQ